MKIIKYFRYAIRDILKFFIVYMPGGLGNRIRYLYYKRRFKKCGKNVIIDVGVLIDGENLISVGDNVHIDKYCIISTGRKLLGYVKRKKNTLFTAEEGELIIGNNVHIAHFSIIMAYGGVIIANNCGLSSGVKIYSLTNLPNDLKDSNKIISIMPHETAPFLLSPIVIEENVWIALNCLVMPGVCIGKNSFVQSNSLLMGKFPENSYISGQPAKRIRSRFGEPS